MNRSKYKHGYIGLIALLISVAIICYFMVTEYGSYFGLGVRSKSTNGTSTSETIVTPIDEAQHAKDLIETRSHYSIDAYP